MRDAVSKYFLPAILLLLCSLPARADYIKVSGSDVDIYYDADFWGAGKATVTDNSISFSTNFSKVASPGSYYLNKFDGLGLYAVAHTGYALTGSTTLGAGGNYRLPGYVFPFGLSSASVNSTSLIYSGSVADGVFDVDGIVGSGSTGASVLGGAKPSKGDFTANSFTSQASGLYEAIGLQNILTVFAFPRSTSAALTSTSFGFDVTQISAVPDIGSSTMILAGMLLVGTMVSNKQRHRS
jgi:hypothetical protein